MKRILHITGAMQRAGAETLLMNLYRNLDRENYQFDFLYFTDAKCDYDEEIESLGGFIYRIPAKGSNKLFRILKRYGDYARLLKKLPEHQIIHSHINLNGALFLLIAYWQNKLIRIAHSHSSNRPGSLYKKLYRSINTIIIKLSANIYITCGKQAANYLFPKIDSKQIIEFPNCVDISKFQNKELQNGSLHKKLKLAKGKRIIVQIGSLTPVKNHFFSIKLARFFKENTEDFHFVFVGEGELKNKLENMILKNNLTDYISFYGLSKNIPEILNNSDLLLMPSHVEGFPVTLVEAQVSGVPCLISDNISKEVDLGLGLISFLSLSANLSDWSNKIYSFENKKRRDFDNIKKIIKSKNFDAVESTKKLQKIYDGTFTI